MRHALTRWLDGLLGGLEVVIDALADAASYGGFLVALLLSPFAVAALVAGMLVQLVHDLIAPTDLPSLYSCSEEPDHEDVRNHASHRPAGPHLRRPR